MHLSAKLSQQQLLSPQMQLGLKLLQAPMMEFRQLVSQELIANPMLEEEISATQETTAPLEKESSLYENMDEAEERRRYFLESQHSVETLADALLAQSAGFSKKDLPIAECIIGNLNTDGYLCASNLEMATTLGTNEQAVEEVVAKIQQLDPPGIAARDLKECLLLQLERKGKGNSLAHRIVKNYLLELGRHHYEEIAIALRVPLEEVFQAHKLIATLEPHPGRAYGPIDNPAIIPDVIVIPDGEDFIVRPNDEFLPRLRLNDHYKEILSTEVENEELHGYLREKIRQGKQFLTHVDQRQKTLLAVAREIIKRQHLFFQTGTLTRIFHGSHSEAKEKADETRRRQDCDQGCMSPYRSDQNSTITQYSSALAKLQTERHEISGLTPLTMAEVAEALDLHPTTISRTVAGKYMETPRGLFPWKYFFTAGLEKEDGTSVSNETIKQALQQLIDQENKEHPLSDQEIVEQLEAQGISVARRTIANYRDQLKILPKKLRRQRLKKEDSQGWKR